MAAAGAEISPLAGAAEPGPGGPGRAAAEGAGANAHGSDGGAAPGGSADPGGGAGGGRQRRSPSAAKSAPRRGADRADRPGSGDDLPSGYSQQIRMPDSLNGQQLRLFLLVANAIRVL